MGRLALCASTAQPGESMRVGSRIMVVLALCLSTLAWVSPEASWARPLSRLSLSATAVLTGETITLKGWVPGKTVRVVLIQKKTGSTWRSVTKVRSNRDGHYRWRTPVKRKATYRVVATRHKRLGTAPSAARTVTVIRDRSTLTANPPTASGNNIVGAFQPVRSRRPVKLQARLDGRWTTIDTTSQNGAGRVYFRWDTAPQGTTRLRLLAGAWRGTAAYAGPERLLNIAAPEKPPAPPVDPPPVDPGPPSEPVPPAVPAPVPVVASFLPSGPQMASAGQPSVSSDGRWIAFTGSLESQGEFAEPFTYHQVWLRDTLLGTTRMVSASAGEPAHAPSSHAEITQDGRHVLYLSSDPALTGLTDDYTSHLVRYDVATGLTTRITQPRLDGFDVLQITEFTVDANAERAVVIANQQLSESLSGHRMLAVDLSTGDVTAVPVPDELHEYSAFNPQISGNGRYVTYIGSHPVAAGSRAQWDVYRTDLTTGTIDKVSALRTSSGTVSGNYNSFDPSISHDGSRVSFASHSTNLGSGDTHSTHHFYVRDFSDDSLLVLKNPENTRFINVATNDSTALSADGRSLAVISPTTTPSDTGQANRVLYIYDLPSGTVRHIFSRSPMASTTEFGYPRLTPNGSHVVYTDDRRVLKAKAN